MATPRCGSYLAYFTVLYWYSAVYGMEGLGEYLAITYPDPQDTGRGIFPVPRLRYQEQSAPFRQISRPLREVASELNRRLEITRNYPGRYVLKVHPHLFDFKNLGWAKRELQWVFAERENLFDQFLSVLISRATDKYYVKGGIKISNKSLEYNSADLATFEDEIYQYHFLKKFIKPKYILVYEELVNLGIKRTLLKSGIAKKWPSTLSEKPEFLPDIQNGPNKLLKFKNPKAIISSYRGSYMQDICPIDEDGKRS